MKYIKYFDTVQGLNTAIQNSEINFIGMAYQGNTPIVKTVTPPPQRDFVEIGGVKWATMNLGANSVTDYGLYFQWAGTQGYTPAQIETLQSQTDPNTGNDLFYENTPYLGEYGSWEKYVVTGFNDTITLDLIDDAVNVAWGGNWRMPTSEEYQSLINASNLTWQTNYNNSGVNGMLCVDKTNSNKVLFFPAGGYFTQYEYSSENILAAYWTKQIFFNCTDEYGLSITFNDEGIYNTINNVYRPADCAGESERGNALNIRGVLGTN